MLYSEFRGQTNGLQNTQGDMSVPRAAHLWYLMAMCFQANAPPDGRQPGFLAKEESGWHIFLVTLTSNECLLSLLLNIFYLLSPTDSLLPFLQVLHTILWQYVWLCPHKASVGFRRAYLVAVYK